MTVITRQRSDNFAIIPNSLAEDDRLSFEARGMLCYLLAKPNNWVVRIADLQKAGGIGRDKVYRLIRELRDTGYVHLDVKRDSNARIISQNYVIYDVAIPDQLPFDQTPKADLLPENPEVEKLLPEKPDPEKPDPENPVTGKAGSGKHAWNNKNPYLIKLTSNNEWFDRLWNAIEPNCRPETHQIALEAFERLPATVDQNNASAQWEFYQTICDRRGETPCLLTYISRRIWRQLIDAPPIDSDGMFVITPDRLEWSLWLVEVEARQGRLAVEQATSSEKILCKERFPPFDQRDGLQFSPSNHTGRMN